MYIILNRNVIMLNRNGVYYNYIAPYLTMFIGSGYANSTLIKDGQAWSWGQNNLGQLGDNSTTSKLTPVSIHGAKKTFCKIDSGDWIAAGIDNHGQVWGWGYNYYGALGDSSQIGRCTPVSIHGSKKTFCSIIAGDYYTSGIDNHGQVWGWGYNYYGVLGDGSQIHRCTPVSIQGLKKTFCSIGPGYGDEVGIDNHGQVWGWGYNSKGKLGNNSTTNQCTPVSIHGAKKTFCTINSSYSDHTAGLEYNGQVWAWGYNNIGQLGDNSTTAQCTPVSILGNKKTFCTLIVGGSNTVGIDYTGQVWTWGSNSSGQLGDNSISNQCTPVSILGNRKTFCKINLGNQYMIGIEHDGRLWSWGDNYYGQLGNNTTRDKCTPISIFGIKKTFCKITSGMNFTSGIDKDGQVWGWGRNISGQLGDNSVTLRFTPVSILGNKKTFCVIDINTHITVGIDKDGQVWSWGYNTFGILGDNSTIDQCTPVSIHGMKKTFCAIGSTTYHTSGIDKDGQVWSWGRNQVGELGTNSNVSQCTPVSILGNKKTFCKINGGTMDTSVIDKDGQVWAWGWNYRGALGDNSVTSRLTPVSIRGAKKTFCSIDGGLYYSIGLEYNGQVWGWGYNTKGQLGNNSTTSKRTPVSILGTRKTFCSIFAGYQFVTGIDNYGQVWSWGDNSNGILGNNSVGLKCTPVSIHGVKKTFCSIGGGTTHMIGIDNYGQAWSWGYNYYGELTSIYNGHTPNRICNL